MWLLLLRTIGAPEMAFLGGWATEAEPTGQRSHTCPLDFDGDLLWQVEVERHGLGALDGLAKEGRAVRLHLPVVVRAACRIASRSRCDGGRGLVRSWLLSSPLLRLGDASESVDGVLGPDQLIGGEVRFAQREEC